MYKLRVPNPDRMLVIKQAFEEGMTKEELFELTNIDPWWLAQLAELHEIECWAKTKRLSELDAEDLGNLKRRGFSDAEIGRLTGGARFEFWVIWGVRSGCGCM